jgi:hypothetical protein
MAAQIPILQWYVKSRKKSRDFSIKFPPKNLTSTAQAADNPNIANRPNWDDKTPAENYEENSHNPPEPDKFESQD